MKFAAIDGGRQHGNFACPWCGAMFGDRGTDGRADPPGAPATLAGHWLRTPECGRNRLVSNQTSSKYVTPGAPLAPPPGAHTLARVERNRDEP